MCQPHACDGLGIRHLEDQNTSFLLKLGYNLVSKEEALYQGIALKVWDVWENSWGHYKRELLNYLEGDYKGVVPAEGEFMLDYCI